MEKAGGNIMVTEDKEAPIKWCSITLSTVIGRGKRLEARTYDIEAKQAWDTVRNGKYTTVNLIGSDSPVSEAYYGGRLKRNYVESSHKDAVGFIGSSEMLDIYPQPVKFMIDSSRADDVRVREGQLLISRSGTIGNLTYVSKTLSKLFVSEHAIRMDCSEYPGYVYAYLKSNIGQKLIQSNIYGAVISEVEPEHLATIPIPNPPKDLKKRINDLIVRSYALRDESNLLIDDASTILIKELELPSIEVFRKASPSNTFSIKLSNMSMRLDASYHLPIVDAINNHLKTHAGEVTTISDERVSTEVILPGRFKRVYVEPGYGRVFIGGKQLWELDPSNKKYLSIVHHGDRIAKQLELHENMTLITCSGTIGKITLVGKHWERWTANQHIIRVVPANKDIAGYISVFLSSDYGYELLTRNTYGSVIDEIDDNQVRQVSFPLLKNQEMQKKINDLALEANAKRSEAYMLEQEALQIMNDEVIHAK